jgi:hypothetical protein
MDNVAGIGEKSNALKILLGIPDESREPRRGWEDSNRMDIKEVSSEVVGWIHLNQERD